MKSKILSIGFALTFIFSSCNSFLDMTPTNEVSDKLLWSKPEYAKLAINNFYHYISIYGDYDLGQSMVGLTEGCTETLKYGSMTLMPHMYFANQLAYADGGITVSTASFLLGGWSDFYTRIRRVNEALYKLNTFSTFKEKERFEAEIRFFRGFLYYELIKRHKNVILYDENLDAIQKDKALSTEEDGWQMVHDDLLFAAENLPEKWNSVEFGRVTKGAAYALLSRAMLYAQRWEDAKIAAKNVIDLGKDTPNGKIYDLAKGNYKDAFKSGSQGNKEAILEFDYLLGGPNHNFNDQFSPKGDPGVVQGGMGTPTQEMVESYELAGTGGFPNWSQWHNTTDGTNVTPPYANLEPRFHATILYNGVSWKGRKIEPYVGGKDGWASFKDDPSPAGKTTTGYYLRKLVDEEADLTKNPHSIQPWIAIRYAEVLLNYAEACYKTNESAEANWAVREIRSRVGLPYTNKDGNELMAAIRQERKIELSYEGHLYWDMRRWKLSHTTYSGPNSRVHGLKIEKIGETFRYTYVDCDKQDRYFPEKLYRIPLPIEELKNNSSVVQFPEWN